VQHHEQGGEPVPVDVYGSGEDIMGAIKQKAEKDNLSITVHDRVKTPETTREQSESGVKDGSRGGLGCRWKSATQN